MKKAFNFRSVLVCVLVLIMCLTAFVACDKNKQPDLSGLENAKSQMYQTYKKLDNSIQTSDFYLVKTVVVGDKTYSIDWSYEVLEGPAENVSLVVDSDKANAVKFVINGQASAETKFVIKGVVKDGEGHQLTIVDNGFTIKVPKFNTATYEEFVAMCKENGSSINENSKTCAVLAYIIGVNCNGSSIGSVWAMDKDGNGYYVYSPKYPEDVAKERDALNAYFPIGTEVVINGTPTIQFGATLQFNKNATIEKTGNTAADKGVTLDYIDATEAWSNATDIKDTALENFQARRIELKGVTMGRQDGNDWYFTVGGVEFICRSNIYLMTEDDQEALENKWVVGGKANIKGIVNVYSQKYQVYPDSVDAIEVIAQSDEEAVESVKASLTLETSYDEDFTLPTSSAATVTWKVEGTGAVIGENNLVTITRGEEDQQVTFTATITKGIISTTKTFTVTIPAAEVVDPNTVILTTKSLNLQSSKYQESPEGGVTVNGVTFAFEEIGYYTDGIQTRVKDDKASKIWNTTAFNKPIKQIIIKLSDGKAGHSNNNTHTISFGNAVNQATYTQQLSTVAEQYEYVITPDVETYTFFKFEHNATHTFSAYFESITIVYAEEKNDTDKVAEAKAALDLGITTTGVSFKLPLVGENGATISWESDNTAVIAINGEDAVVTAPAAETVVKLTATITVGEAHDTKEFNVTVTVTIPEFDVTITQPAAGGSIEVKNGTEAIASGKFQQGTVLTITATPADANHELVAIKVNGTAITAVDGVYSVTVTDAVEITAEFKEIKYATVTIGAVENGTLTVKNGEEEVVSGNVFRDGTVLTITATTDEWHKVVAIKVNGKEITVSTYTITGEESTIEITVEIAEKYVAKTIAEFKALPESTSATDGFKITGVITSLDKKAAYIQDQNGEAVYVFFGYKAPYSDTLKTMVVGKEYTFCGNFGYYNGAQLTNPVVYGEARDPENAIVAKDLDEEAYTALTLADIAEFVNVKGLKVVDGKFMLGATAISYYTGNVPDAEKAELDKLVALLTNDVQFDLVNVHVSGAKDGGVQITIDHASSIVIDWEPVATIDIAEIGVEVTAQITVTAKPAVTTDIKATFVSDHPEYATVDENGKVTGVAAGTATITVTANGKTTTVTVTVVENVEKCAVKFTKEGTNGNITTVTVDGKEINSGDEIVKGKTIIVTVAPADGYRLASVTIGEGTADTSVVGKTSFELTITADTTFAVAFEEIPVVKTNYSYTMEKGRFEKRRSNP